LSFQFVAAPTSNPTNPKITIEPLAVIKPCLAQAAHHHPIRADKTQAYQWLQSAARKRLSLHMPAAFAFIAVDMHWDPFLQQALCQVWWDFLLPFA
jgi:hypothetical protein